MGLVQTERVVVVNYWGCWSGFDPAGDLSLDVRHGLAISAKTVQILDLIVEFHVLKFSTIHKLVSFMVGLN